VTTDVASRGLDLPVDLVIHTPDMALSAEQYIHRAGRLRSKGTSVMCVPKNKAPLHLQKALNIKFSVEPLPSDDALRLKFVEKLACDCEEAIGLDANAFVDEAAEQLEANGAKVLAQALSVLERRKKHFVWASALSGRMRHTPVLLFDPGLEKMRSRLQVLGLMRKTLGNDERFKVGRVALTKKGYIVDLAFEDAKRVMRDPEVKKSGVTPMLVSVIPEVITNELKHRMYLRRVKHGASAREKVRSARARLRARRETPSTLSGHINLRGPYTRGGCR